MPLYYDSGSPSEGSKNSIDITAKTLGLRDHLLKKNIQNPTKYPYLGTGINGSPKGGQPVLDTSVGTNSVIEQVSIEVDGQFRYENSVVMNHYKNTDPNSYQLTDIENISRSSQFPITPYGSSNYTNEDITQYGLLAKMNYANYRLNNTLNNLYIDTPQQIDMADLVSTQPILTNQQLGGYLDEYGDLNLGDASGIQSSNILGSVLGGQSLGISAGGIIPNFDVRASIAGRTLGASGGISDTKLGIIGGQQLVLALANNAAFNAQKVLTGALDISDNIMSLVKTGDLSGIGPDYTITVPSTFGGQIADYTERILGFSVPRSYLGDDGSIFQTENGNAGDIARSNSMLLNTGSGQVKSLIRNVSANVFGIASDGSDNTFSTPFRSGYVPGYTSSNGTAAINPNGYVFMDNNGNIISLLSNLNNDVIPQLSYNRSKMIETYGFTDPENAGFNGDGSSTAVSSMDSYGNSVSHIITPTFSWGSASSSGTTKPVNTLTNTIGLVNDRKTLLGKTQLLFNSIGMKNIVSVKGDMSIGAGDQLQTSVIKGGISKGSAVMSSGNFNADGSIKYSKADSDPNNVFCRSWTTFNRYDSVNKLIRHKGVNQSEGSGQIIPAGNKWRYNTPGSVLDDNGFVKIAPYKTDNLTRQATTPKKYMFSLENLAWVGAPALNLLPIEQGPGDLLTGKFGRIMWFPPYDLTFSETSSINIESNVFIGRGEPLYTYNNTERTGNLSFKIIVDHPSIMNSFAGANGPTDEFIRSWVAGCTDLDPMWANKLTQDEVATQQTRQVKQVVKKSVDQPVKPTDINIYFENDVTVVVPEYENGIGSGLGSYQGEPQTHCSTCKASAADTWPDRTNYGLNAGKQSLTVGSNTFAGWVDPAYIPALTDYLTNTCTTCKAKIIGYASGQGTAYANGLLATNRAQALSKWLTSNGILTSDRITIDTTDTQVKSGVGMYTMATPVDQLNPKSDRFATISFFVDQTAAVVDNEPNITDPTAPAVTLNEQVKRRFFTESDFFEKLKETDSFVFDKIKEKIRYFNPAFHSMTPEGFNSRLTFLLQCTRQGPTIPGVEAKNLAFGPPPVCILRIGDFYNTKIMIDNISFDFEEQLWDLNPEGIGVQPMIARVNMSFKYIGGSSLYGPINKLQNALSFNYFANTRVYDPRADNLIKGGDSRNTFGSTTSTEDSYVLVPGLDITKQSMAADPNVVPTDTSQDTPNKDQVTAASSVATKTQQATPAASNTTDQSKLIINNINAELGTSILFSIGRKNNSDSSGLSQDYAVSATISNVNNSSESFQIVLTGDDGKLLSTDLTKSFDIILSATSPVCGGLLEGNSYQLRIKLIGLSGSGNIILNKNI